MNFNWLTSLGDFIFPACCVQCHQLCHNQIHLCQTCENQLPQITLACPVCRLPNKDGLLCPVCYYHPPAFSRILCPYLYHDPLPKFIQALKFSSQLLYSKLFAELILKAIHQDAKPLPLCIIPMPLHPKRTRQRGFNQSLEIANVIGKRLKIPLEKNAVVRKKNTVAQSTIARHERQNNLSNAFQVINALPKHVAIVDDVVTTGATVNSLAHCLKKRGVETIEVWCVARTVMDS